MQTWSNIRHKIRPSSYIRTYAIFSTGAVYVVLCTYICQHGGCGAVKNVFPCNRCAPVVKKIPTATSSQHFACWPSVTLRLGNAGCASSVRPMEGQMSVFETVYINNLPCWLQSWSGLKTVLVQIVLMFATKVNMKYHYTRHLCQSPCCHHAPLWARLVDFNRLINSCCNRSITLTSHGKTLAADVVILIFRFQWTPW